MFNTLLPEKSILPAHPWANMAGRRNKKHFYICSEVIDSITDANSRCFGGGLGWFRCGLGWFGASMTGQRNKKVFKFLQLLILSQKHILGVKKVVWDDLEVVWGVLGVFPRTLIGCIISRKKYLLSLLIFLL